MTMLNKLLSGTPDGIAWFADQAPLHATELLDILRTLDRLQGTPTPSLITVHTSAKAILSKMARTADEGAALDEHDAKYFQELPR